MANENAAIRIRVAGDSDWPAIWPIVRAVAAARDSFTFPTGLANDHGRALWMSSRAIVAEDEAGNILGTAKMGANQMGPGSHVATGSFMVAASARGRGVGRLLGEAMIDWAKSEKFRAIQFNAVVSTNVVALALWQKLGFEIVGTVPGAFAHPEKGEVALYVMHRRL